MAATRELSLARIDPATQAVADAWALLGTCATGLGKPAQTYRGQGRPVRALCFGAAAPRLRRAAPASGDHWPDFWSHTLCGSPMEARRPAAARPLLREAPDVRQDASAENARRPHRVGTAGRLADWRFALGERAEALAPCAAHGLDAAARRAGAARFHGG